MFSRFSSIFFSAFLSRGNVPESARRRFYLTGVVSSVEKGLGDLDCDAISKTWGVHELAYPYSRGNEPTTL